MGRKRKTEKDLLFASRSFSTTCVGRALRGFRHSGFEARSFSKLSWRTSRVRKHVEIIEKKVKTTCQILL